MNLKNYTSSVTVEKTISRIEQLIAKFGASHIAKEYDQTGSVKALQFMLQFDGKSHIIKLPSSPEQVCEAMMAEISKPQTGTRQRIMEQSQRTSWKLMQDWIEVQLSLIYLRQAEPMQVFLPYIWDGQQTYYQFLKGNKFKALPAPQQ